MNTKNCDIANYCIKPGYVHRTNELPLVSKTNDVVDFSQKEVYELATSLCKESSYQTVLDYGCGNGYKLEYYLSKYHTIGYDHPELISHCQKKYPTKEWRSIHGIGKETNPENVDLIICADVIEHATQPEKIISFFKQLKPKTIIFSTPDRDSWDVNDNGPPSNLFHCREWNADEFKCYISHFFNITFTTLISQAGYNYLLVLCEEQ